ncbi:MAG: DUF5110 domain-containing protein [Clostridium sp.]|nr:DUF5110 domain-containing protein [Clostridium sp.]MCM1444138.1 DUF5110 domain-containing protein [Candidatus Amulumruptor caecigallinarius]
MYKIGEQFKMNQNAVSKTDSVIKGNKYRITVLSERLLRLEYNENGIFIDNASELVINRNFDIPKFEKIETNEQLFISTPCFRLVYQKEKVFGTSKLIGSQNLRIDVYGTKKVWFFGTEQVRNYGAPGTELAYDNALSKLKKSLYSPDGYTILDDSNGRIFDEEGNILDRDTNGIDMYFFAYGHDFISCLSDYYKLTGYPSLVPRYVLGNWWYREYAYSEEELKKLINKFYDNDIPLSIVMLGSGWHINNKQNSGFTFNKEKFPEPKSIINYLHNMGIRLGLSVNPIDGFYPTEDNYEELKKYLQEEKGKIPFNALDSRCIDVYLKLIIHKLDNYGVDFYWIDYFDKNKLDTLNILKHYHFYDMKRDYRKRPLVFANNSLIAPHRYPVLYSGHTKVSWETLKALSYHNVNSTNIGVSWWCHDIGGYSGGIEDNELYTRYVQLGTFSPILRLSAGPSKFYKREPWRWEIKTYEISKMYLKLRHKLIPYLYSEAYLNSKYGVPLITPLYYIKHEMYDDVLYKSEYYFGSQLFISPIVTSKDYTMDRVIHKFYIPDGTWYDFFTGKRFTGNKKYVSFFKDEDYPVFAKQGAIIPLGTNKNINDTTLPTDMEIHIFPGKSNTFKLYEDDGVSNLYLSDYYLMTIIDYNYMPNNYTLIIRAAEGKSGIVPEKRNYKFKFRNTKQADEVSVYLGNEKINFNSYVEKENFIVEVNDIETIGKQLTVNCKGKDIEVDAIGILNEDIEDILSDLPIETTMKEEIAKVLFGNLSINKKRIAIRRFSNKGLDRKFIQLLLKLLEYVKEI